MNLDALIEGKTSILVWFLRLSFKSHIQQIAPLFRCFW
jgi:hypothetical protein